MAAVLPLASGDRAPAAAAAPLDLRVEQGDLLEQGVALGAQDAAFGRAWVAPHAPACTARELVSRAAGVIERPPRLRVLTPAMMRLGAVFSAEARESLEMLYQFRSPFAVDSSETERAFGVAHRRWTLEPSERGDGTGRGRVQRLHREFAGATCAG